MTDHQALTVISASGVALWSNSVQLQTLTLILTAFAAAAIYLAGADSVE